MQQQARLKSLFFFEPTLFYTYVYIKSCHIISTDRDSPAILEIRNCVPLKDLHLRLVALAIRYVSNLLGGLEEVFQGPYFHPEIAS